jgi:hypothetical protein
MRLPLEQDPQQIRFRLIGIDDDIPGRDLNCDILPVS